MSVRIAFGFIPFPLAIVDEGLDLSLGEYRLLGYLLRHHFRVKTESMRLTQDDLLRGVRATNGERRDKGCGITSPRDLKAARELLEARTWIRVTKDAAGAMIYELTLANEADSDSSSSAICTDQAEASAKCTGAEASAICSDGECNLFTSPVQNALALIGSKKVKKVKEEVLVLTADAVQRRRSGKSPNVRHEACREVCEAYASHKGVGFVWDGSEGKALALLLQACPEMTVERFTECVRHRARSPVAHGERPRVWLPTLPRYQDGPLDRFGKPEGENNGTSGRSTSGPARNVASGAARRTDGNLHAAQRVYESVVGSIA